MSPPRDLGRKARTMKTGTQTSGRSQKNRTTPADTEPTTARAPRPRPAGRKESRPTRVRCCPAARNPVEISSGLEVGGPLPRSPSSQTLGREFIEVRRRQRRQQSHAETRTLRPILVSVDRDSRRNDFPDPERTPERV